MLSTFSAFPTLFGIKELKLPRIVRLRLWRPTRKVIANVFHLAITKDYYLISVIMLRYKVITCSVSWLQLTDAYRPITVAQRSRSNDVRCYRRLYLISIHSTPLRFTSVQSMSMSPCRGMSSCCTNLRCGKAVSLFTCVPRSRSRSWSWSYIVQT